MIAVYGGAFDPLHLGHIKVIQNVLRQPEIQQLRLLPCYQHPDKGNTHSSAIHRLNMLKLITRAPVVIDQRELDRRGISYTIDTMDSLRQEYPANQSIVLVLGQDVYATVSNWQRAARLAELVHLLVIARPAAPIVTTTTLWRLVDSLQVLLEEPAGCVFFMRNELVDVSSSQIRALIASGQSPRYLIPGTVWNYIQRNQLYGYQKLE